MPASYHVKEIFYSLQGEGARTGRAAVFCRFAGCNLWSGREQERARALCTFCDTDFRGTTGAGGGRFGTAGQLADAIEAIWGGGRGPGIQPYAVLTGGEPLLQLDEALITALHVLGFEVAVETNGTRPVPPGLDWLCVSPKAGVGLVLRAGDELKLVYPQAGAEPEVYAGLDFRPSFLQPLGGPDQVAHPRQALAYCLAHPQWRLSLQTHKLLGIP